MKDNYCAVKDARNDRFLAWCRKDGLRYSETPEFRKLEGSLQFCKWLIHSKRHPISKDITWDDLEIITIDQL